VSTDLYIIPPTFYAVSCDIISVRLAISHFHAYVRRSVLNPRILRKGMILLLKSHSHPLPPDNCQQNVFIKCTTIPTVVKIDS